MVAATAAATTFALRFRHRCIGTSTSGTATTTSRTSRARIRSVSKMRKNDIFRIETQLMSGPLHWCVTVAAKGRQRLT